MRHIALPLLASVAIATAAQPIDSAINTTQGAEAERRITAYGQRQMLDGGTVPELYPGENDDVGPQFLVMPKVRKTYFEAGLDLQYYYTSNALLSEKGNIDTGILLTTGYFGWAPTPIDLWGGQWAWRTGYRQQVYNYGLDQTSNQLNNIDFTVGTVYLGGRYTFGANWTASLGIDYNRYLSLEADNTEFYTEALPQWGLEKFFPINDRNIISIGYFGGYHLTFTDPLPTTNINDRIDSILLLTSVHQLTERLILQPYYRFQQTHYWENSDRNDFFNTFGVALAFRITDWASVRAFTSFEMRESTDQSIPDYSKWDTGGGLSLAIKF